jgi:MFS family permease
MPTEKWVSRDFVVAWVAMFLLSMDFYLCMVTTSSYAISVFGVSSAMAALSTSVAVCSAIITRVIVGRSVFRMGCIRTLIIGFAANAAVSGCYFFTTSFGVLLAVRFVHGLCIGAASTAIFTVASVIVPKSKSGVGMGYFSLSTTLGAAVGPFLASVLTRSGNYIPLYTLTTLVTVLAAGLALLIRQKKACLPEPGAVSKPPLKGLASVLDMKMLPVAVISGVVFATYGCVINFLPVSSQGTNLETAASYFFILYAAGLLFSRPLAGRIFDRHGENPMMYAGLVLFSAGILLTGMARSGPMLLFAAVLDGVGLGAIQTVALAIGVKYAAPERLGLANSTFFITLDTGLTVGPIFGGLLVPFVGYAGVYVLGMPVALAGIVIYYFIHGRRHRTIPVVR